MQPFDPMAPIYDDTIPTGADWGYQLKWDGVRLIASVDAGSVELVSRKMLPKNTVYPELVRKLSERKGRFVVDGEAVVFDPVKQRPVFQRVLQRERLRTPASIRQGMEREPVRYVLFDLLQQGGEDLRGLPYAERHERLLRLFPEREEQLFVTDLFPNGEALWGWVEANEWEGVVSKHLSSRYREGKKHKDWFKKKVSQQYTVTVVGFTFREGRLASLATVYDGRYFGRVSLGLTVASKQELLVRYAHHLIGAGLTAPESKAPSPFPNLPSDLRRETVVWLERPFDIRVTGLEMTDDGMLRHPKIVSLTIGG